MRGVKKQYHATDHSDVIAFAFLDQKVVAFMRADEARKFSVLEWRLDRIKADSRGHKHNRGTRFIVSEFSKFPVLRTAK